LGIGVELFGCCVVSEAAAHGFVLKPPGEEAEEFLDEMFSSLFGKVAGNPQGFKFCVLLGIEADVGGLATGVVVVFIVFVEDNGSGASFEARGCCIDEGGCKGSGAIVDGDVFGVSNRENSGASDVTSASFIVADVDDGVG